MNLINLTDEVIVIQSRARDNVYNKQVIEPSDFVLLSTDELVDNIPITEGPSGEVVSDVKVFKVNEDPAMPPPQEGDAYIVDVLVAHALRGRRDDVFTINPSTAEHDDAGRLVVDSLIKL